MSDSGQSGAGQREVAYRLFATEFEDADRSHSESDEERAPNYVVTPTGARINRLFVVGVLTEVEQVSDDVLRGRVVDPTGAFVVYAGQYQPDEMAFLETADSPMFVAVTGKARTFQPDDSDRVFTSVRPESINEVDADTRDRWTVQAAEQTLDRIARMARALGREERGDDLRRLLEDNDVVEGLAAGIPIAIDHYETTPAYLAGLRETALDAAGVVAGTDDEVSTPDTAPDEGGDARLEPLQSAGVDVAPIGGSDEGEGESGAASAATGGPTADTGTTTAESADLTTEQSEQTGPPDAADTDSPAEEPVGSVEATTNSGGGGGETTPTGRADERVSDSAAETDDLGDFDPGEYELEDETREEIEEEYGTEFQTGTEVEEPGSADIETSEQESPGERESATDTPPEDSEPPETTESPHETTESPDKPDETTEPDKPDKPDETAEPDETTEPDDLQAAVVDLMTELDDGDGADRAAVLEEMQARYGTDGEATEDAIQDALMDGECYEPDEQTLKPI